MEVERPQDTAAIIAAIERYHSPTMSSVEGKTLLPRVSVDRVPYALMPKGMELKSLKPLIAEYADRPERIERTVGLDTVDSLVEYYNRFSGYGTSVWCQITTDPWAAKLTVRVDDHVPITGDNEEPIPAWNRHAAHYDFPLSEELEAWLGVINKAITQDQLGEFLEDRIQDVIDPPVNWEDLPAGQIKVVRAVLGLFDDYGDEAVPEDEFSDKHITRLTEKIHWGNIDRLQALAIQIDVTASKRVKQATDQKTGARVFEFKEDLNETATGEKLVLPDYFLINIPLFREQQRRLLPVRLKARIAGSQVKWGLHVPHLIQVLEHAVLSVVEQVEERLEVTVLRGTTA